MTIAFKEGIQLDANAIDQLVQASSNDIRQILNTLQTWRLTRQQMTYDQSKEQ
jgi:replication factor C subunit 1